MSNDKKKKQVLFLFSRLTMEKQRANPATLTALFNAEAEKDNTLYTYACYDDLIHEISEDSPKLYDAVSGKDLKDFDLVYQRSWGYSPETAMAVAIYLAHYNVPQLDDEMTNRPGSMNKLTQHWRLWEHGLPCPKTAFMNKQYVTEWIDNSLEAMFTYPIIMKSIGGTRGSDNHLVSSRAEAHALVKEYSAIDFLIQEFIPNDGDYRVLVCDDAVGMVIHRKAAAGTHKNNTSQGGSAAIIDASELPADAIEASIRAAKVFQRNIAGVDLVFDKRYGHDRFYFFEVNRAPQIEASSYSPEKVAVLHDFFLKRMRRKGKDNE